MTRKLKEEYEKWKLATNLEKNQICLCVREGREILKFDGGEEIELCTECTDCGTKTDQSGDNTTEIKHRISQTRKTLNFIWWHKNITKNRKLYVYQTTI